MMISVLTAVLGQWLIRKKAFRIIASYGVATALLLGAIKTMAGLINPSALALIAANVFGSLAGAALTFLGWRHVSRSAEPEADEKHVPRTVWQLAKQHGPTCHEIVSRGRPAPGGIMPLPTAQRSGSPHLRACRAGGAE